MSSSEEEFEFDNKQQNSRVGNEEYENNEGKRKDTKREEPIPLKRKRSTTSYQIVDEDDDDDDEEFEEDEEEDNNDDDEESEDDDDIPLSKLKSSGKKTKTKQEKPISIKSAKAQSPKSAPASKSSAEVAKKGTTAVEDFRTLSDAFFGSECLKGQLVQKLLCRWWYSIDWPRNLPENPPINYDALDGMPGLYVCVEGDDVGKILDLRDSADKPSFSNLLSKSSDELKELLISAIQRQLEALVAAEGEGTSTERDLKEMLKWTMEVNPDKAEKEAEKIIKKFKAHSQ